MKNIPRSTKSVHQAEIAQKHLVLSPFAPCTPVVRGSFPVRNRLMATVCDATVIVEANEQSGTKHQAEACLRLHRDLFFCASLVANPSVRWTQRFTGPRSYVLTHTEQIIERVRFSAA